MPLIVPASTELRVLFPVLLFAVLTGCAMAGPGVARGTPQTPEGQHRNTTYNNQWVAQPANEVDSLDSMNQTVKVTDISERELGKVYVDPDVASGKYASEADKQVAKVLEARQAQWNARMRLSGSLGSESAPQAGK